MMRAEALNGMIRLWEKTLGARLGLGLGLGLAWSSFDFAIEVALIAL